MKNYHWDVEKNNKLIESRGVSFEEVVYYINQGQVLDIIEHPNQSRYPGQKIFIVGINNYVYLVSFSESGNEIYLRTIFPSRKLTKKYFKGDESYETTDP